MSRQRVDLSSEEDDDFNFNDYKKYKKEIPELKRIKMNLKRRAYDLKHNLKDGLAIRESLIEDVNSLKRKVAQLERELNELTKGDSV